MQETIINLEIVEKIKKLAQIVANQELRIIELEKKR